MKYNMHFQTINIMLTQ